MKKENKLKKENLISIDDLINFFNKKHKILNLKTFYKNFNLIKKSINDKILGQSDSVDTILDNILVNYSNKNRISPIGVYLFVGDTGVGKTELAKTIADKLFGGNIVKIDMNKYKQKFDVSGLIGSPPGYVGYEEGGKLTEPVKNNPFTVILLDEIEKGHPDAFDILLNIIDEGKITDFKQEDVFFNNTIIIMTSNIGTSYNKNSIGFNENEKSDKRFQLNKFFKKEFLARLDEIIYFNNLSSKIYNDILQNIIVKYEKNLNIQLKIDKKDLKAIVNTAFNEKLGVRYMESIFKKQILTPYLKNQLNLS